MSETDEQKGGGSDDCDVHLHAEIEALKQALVDKQSQLIAMETACLRESDRQVELEDSIIAWQDKYERLYESHKRVQKVNQTLEDKLLKLVDRNSGERAQLTSDVATLSVRLAQANYNIAKLQHEIERYKTDINLAIQLLQCKPDSFVPQKVSSLPVDIQSKVSSYMRLETNSHSDSEGSTSGVGLATSGSYKVLPASDSPPPLCPFPPTAMVYSMRGLDARNNTDCNGKTDQMVSPSAMAKYLQDELKASEIKHCDTCNCSPKDLTVLIDEPRSYNVGTQTLVQSESGNSLCLRCNSNLNSPSRTNSPYIMKIVKSSDSVISETKSSVSDLLDNEKLFTPAKKDDLMVNPILGHHRLCDRTTYKQLQQQQQQICDTAKFILETRKLENEIPDLRRFDAKSPKVSPRHDTRNTFSLNLPAGSESKLSDLIVDVRQNDPITLLSDIVGDNKSEVKVGSCDSQQVQGTCTSVKSDISDMVGDKKPEHKVQQENGSLHGSNDKQMNNGGNAITGSTNSLWSKSSSSEGAKIFENFNRNLIKTIKAENPTHRGPRLCALRIQNGSNNILLDNIDSEITPVVYTRPSRFLDEELDDSKDIITSKISMLMTKREMPLTTSSSQVNALAEATSLMSSSQLELIDPALGGSGVESKSNLPNFATPVHGDNNSHPASQSTDIYCDAIHAMLHVSNVDISLDNQKTKQQDQQSGPNKAGDTPENGGVNLEVAGKHDTGRENMLSSFCNNVALHASHCPEQQQYWNGLVLDIHANQQNKPHYEVMMLGVDNSLNSSFKNATSKSGTQSSSVSSGAVDIDVQETALLRRQQLTRVAEWVQNNSQQHHDNKLASIKQFCHEAHVPGGNPNHNAVSRSSMSGNSSTSVEKFSITDSMNCTAPRPILLNGMHNTLNNNYYHFPRQPHEQCTISQDNKIMLHHHQRSADPIAHNNYHSCNHNLSIRYKISGTDPPDVTTPNQITGSGGTLELNHPNPPQESRTVDLAQMEYNVKQFLLKQNEWSICNVSNSASSQKTTNTTSAEITVTAKKMPVNSHLNSSSSKKPAIVNNSLPFRTETNL